MPKRPWIIAFTGLAGCGKDTAGRALIKQMGFQRFAFADPIKAALNAMLGFEQRQWEDREWKEAIIPELGTSPRILAQTLGTEWGRNQVDKDFWVKATALAIKKSQTTRAVITDLRFPNEAKWVQEMGGLVVEISRPGVEKVATHASEAGISMNLIDFTIKNDFNNATDFRAQVVREIEDAHIMANSV